MTDFAGIRLLNFVIIGAGILGWALLFRTLFAAREGILWALRAACIGALVMMVTQLILVGAHRTEHEVIIGSYVITALAVAATPKRSRYIRSGVRKRVLDRGLKGERYDSRKHHIDHIWPHSRGGSNTADNLRVISRTENLRKGARRPGLRDWL